MYNKCIGSYRILEKLGAGGMATVYKAVPEATLDEKESVAIKIMQLDKAENEEFTERFKREMRISTEMNHPNILRILDFGDDEGVLYIVMELVRGKTLRKVIPDEGFDLESFMEVYRPVLQALKYAHEHNVIHRDLKPDNIMMTDMGRIVVMDFGLARHQGGSMITASGVAMGTPAYMSPEQVSGKSLDARTDQYSLGVLAFQMLTGQLPFYDENTINIMFKHVSDPPPPLRQYRSDIPVEMEQVVLRMLEKDPKNRYRDLEDVLRSMGAATRTRR
jgi:serine/threonine-protein kinase